MFAFIRRRRRAKIMLQPFPEEWRRVLQRWVGYYQLLNAGDQRLLEKHIQVFLAEKHFEGCDGFEMTDEVRVAIAAFACILILRAPGDYYPGLRTVLVYPEAFYVPMAEEGPDGVMSLDPEERAGESWDRGTVILGWEEVVESTRDGSDGYNVVLHEFAHQLEFAHRSARDDFGLATEDAWSDVIEEAYDDLVKQVRRNRPTLIDDYGATDPAEFFAVATETFFERPIAMERRHAALYEALKTFYQQDPAELTRTVRSA